MRIGVMKEGFGRPESDPATNSAVHETLARMQAAGAELEEIAVPAHEEMFAIFSAIVAEGTAALMFGAGTGGYAEGFTSMALLDAFAQGWRERGGRDQPLGTDHAADGRASAAPLPRALLRQGSGAAREGARRLHRRVRPLRLRGAADDPVPGDADAADPGDIRRDPGLRACR